MRRLFMAAGAIAAALAVAEGVARIAGLVDFPIYTANNRIGYAPNPNQSGRFMRDNDWVINDLGMGIAKPFADTINDVLLVGDSIVWGGNSYRQADKLGPQVQQNLLSAQSDAMVWPISAGSWAIVNETNWLEDHPAVANAAETMIFVLNGADFNKPSSWSNPLTHPRKRPTSALVYLASKYLIKPSYGPATAEMVVPDAPTGEALAKAITNCDCNVQIWLHPTKSELAAEPRSTQIEQEFAKIEHLLPVEVAVHRVREITGWNDELYQDEIHPTPQGLEIMGRAISDAILQ